MRIQIEVTGVPVVVRDLTRFASRAADLRPVTNDIAAVLADVNRRTFDSEGVSSPAGRWAPLTPRYARWKAVHYPGQKILVRTGALRRSLVELPLGIQTSTTDSITLGTAVPYAKYHQQGTAHMRARPPVSVSESAKRRMMKILQKYLAEGKP